MSARQPFVSKPYQFVSGIQHGLRGCRYPSNLLLMHQAPQPALGPNSRRLVYEAVLVKMKRANAG